MLTVCQAKGKCVLITGIRECLAIF